MFTGTSGSWTVRQASTMLSYRGWSVVDGAIIGVPSMGISALAFIVFQSFSEFLTKHIGYKNAHV